MNSFPATSATASACSPSRTGTRLRTSSTALSLSGSYARKFRTVPGFPSKSKVVTRTFHPAAIAALCAATLAGQQRATLPFFPGCSPRVRASARRRIPARYHLHARANGSRRLHEPAEGGACDIKSSLRRTNSPIDCIFPHRGAARGTKSVILAEALRSSLFRHVGRVITIAHFGSARHCGLNLLAHLSLGRSGTPLRGGGVLFRHAA